MNHPITASKYHLKENTGGVELFDFHIIPLKRVTDTSWEQEFSYGGSLQQIDIALMV